MDDKHTEGLLKIIDNLRKENALLTDTVKWYVAQEIKVIKERRGKCNDPVICEAYALSKRRVGDKK